MRSHLWGRFYRKTARGGGGGADVAEGVNEWEEDFGAWRSSAGPCRIHAGPGDHAEPCVSSLRGWRVRGDGESDDGTRTSVVESGGVDEFRGNALQSVGNRASAASDDRVGKKFGNRHSRAVSYQGMDELEYCFLGNPFGKSMRAPGALADSRLRAFHSLDDWVAEVFTKNAYRSGGVSGNHAELTINPFQRLDDRAAEVLRKSSQALESSHSLKCGTLLWDGPEPRNGSLHPRDVCEQALYKHLRGGGTMETATPAMMMRAFKELISDRYEFVKKMDSPDKKLGGAFSAKSVTQHTEEKLPWEYFVEFQREETSSPVPSSASKSEDSEHSAVRSNLMNYSSGDESKCEVSPRRICRWARLPTKSQIIESNPKNPQMPSKSRKVLSFTDDAKGCNIHGIHHNFAKHREEEDYDFCSIHLKHNEPAPPPEEGLECHSVHSKLHEVPEQREEMQDLDLHHGMLSSLQGASGVPSRTDSIQHDCSVEVQDTSDTSEESAENMGASDLLRSSVKCDDMVKFGEERTETSKATQTSDVKEKQSGRSSHKNYRFEGVGVVTTPRSTPRNDYKACMSSTKNGILVRGAKPLDGKGSLHSESASLPATPKTSRTKRSPKEALRSPDQSKYQMPPDKSLAKRNPSLEVFPAPRKQRSATTGLKALSEGTIEEVPKTSNKDKQVESLKVEAFSASEDPPIATTAEDPVKRVKKNGETIKIYSTEAGLRRTSGKNKCTQTPQSTEMVEISAESESSLPAKSTQTVGLPSQKSLRITAQHRDISNDAQESLSDEKVEILNKNPNTREDESRYGTDLFATRESLPPRTSNSKSDTVSGAAGLKPWPTAIPDLDKWITEVVSGWLGSEECFVQKIPNNTSVPVSTTGTAVALNVGKRTKTHGNDATPLKLSSLHVPDFWLTTVGKSLDTQIKRLAEIDSKVSRAHSINNLFQILEEVSTIRQSPVHDTINTAKRSTSPALHIHEFEKDEVVQNLHKHKYFLEDPCSYSCLVKTSQTPVTDGRGV